jgi:DNA-binding MltR family transcriptional regulator
MESLFIKIIKWSAMVDAEISNQSDRATALVCCSMLDSQLQILLKNFLVDDDKVNEDLFNNNMPLSTFSSKINFAYYLGLISSDERNNLNTLRKIRNVFAHQLEVFSFDNSQSVIDQAKNLFIPPKMFVPELLILQGDEALIDQAPFKNDNTPKNRFIQTFKYLSTYLNFRIHDVVEIKRYEYKADTFVNLYRNLINEYKDSLECNREIKKELLESQKSVLKQKIELSNIRGEKADEEEQQLSVIVDKLETGSYLEPDIMAQKYGISEDEYYEKMYIILDRWDKMQ